MHWPLKICYFKCYSENLLWKEYFHITESILHSLGNSKIKDKKFYIDFVAIIAWMWKHWRLFTLQPSFPVTILFLETQLDLAAYKRSFKLVKIVIS